MILALAAPIGVAGAAEQSLTLHDTPQPVPAIRFVNGEGRALGLKDFRGKVVLLNVWATWCYPCRKEMPTLDRLQALLGGPDFEVVPLSIDRAGLEPVKQFYAQTGVTKLGIFIDTSAKAAADLGAFGIPTTLLIGRDGQELGRLVGPAEWDSPAMIALMKRVIASPSTASAKEKSK